MERFDIRKDSTTAVGWRVTKRDDGLGMFVYAEEALQYKSSFYQAFLFSIVLAIMCSALAGYIVFHKHDPVPVQKVSEEEYQRTIQEQRRLQIELSATQKRMADLKAATEQFKSMLQTSNANNAKLVRQLKEVQASVPPLPIIQDTIRKEAATDAGFKAAVERSFGNDIAAHIQIKGVE